MTRFRLAPFSKRSVFNCLHSGQRFQMYAFSMKTLSAVVWTIGENPSKSMRFRFKRKRISVEEEGSYLLS